jgi:signal transduction histidine kinase
MKIKQKLTLSFISIALLVAVVGYISVNASQKALQKSIGEQSTALAANMIEHIDRCIYSRIETFQEYSKNSIIQRVISQSNREFEKLDNIQTYISEKDREWTSTPKEEVTTFMQELINNELSEKLREKTSFYQDKYCYRVFGEVFVTNKYGANTAQTGKTTDYYQADEQWWQMAKKDCVYVADVEYDRSAEVYSTDICIRIDDETGNFLGVMKVVLNIEETIAFIEKAAAEEEHKTVQLKLLTKDAKIIYATEEFEFLQNLPMQFSSLVDPEEEQDGHISYFVAAGDKPGEGEKLFAHADSKGYKDFGAFDWILVVELETDEVLAPVAKLRVRILFISLVVATLASLLGFLISKTLSGPIGKLAVAAAEIGTGNLNTRLEVKSNDEVGQLATSFNKMAQDLRNTTTSIDNLNREITKRKKTEKALKTSNKNLEISVQKLNQLNQQLREFVYIASHDLREPSRKVSSFGGILAESLAGKLNDDEQENLDFMISGAERMQQMVESLLVYSRVTTKDVTFEEIDLNEMIEQLKDLELANNLEEANGSVLVPEPLLSINSDVSQTRQLLQNLITNALKYRKKDAPPEITIRTHKQDNNMVRVEVQDNGIGIEEKQYNNIFVMFRRLHSRQEYDGTGIGLAVCKKIVERHNGEIGVSSTYGQGSTFWFTIPAAKTAGREQEQLVSSLTS